MLRYATHPHNSDVKCRRNTLKYISIKGLILSGIAYVVFALILSVLIPKGIYSMLNVECGQDLYSTVCQTYINRQFGPSFLVLVSINTIAIFASIGILANYSTKLSLKPNYSIYVVLNLAFTFSYLSTNTIYESIAEAIVILLIVGFSYKNEISKYNDFTESSESTST